jgi:hypothetical protein
MRPSVVSHFIQLFDPTAQTLLPAAQGQSCNSSLRCDNVLETCGHYIYASEDTTTTHGDNWRWKGPKSFLGPTSQAKRNPEKAMLS